MRKLFLLLIGCSLVCVGAYRWGDTRWESAKTVAMEYMYREVSQFMMPCLYAYEIEEKGIVYRDVERLFLPIVSNYRMTEYVCMAKEGDDLGQEGKGTQIEEGEVNSTEGQTSEEQVLSQEVVANGAENQMNSADTSNLESVFSVAEKQVVINRLKLQEFDYLRQNFYQVDNTTTIGSELLNATKFLEKDMTLAQEVEGPQILIYHTHSQEAYANSEPGDSSTSVVAVGDYLEVLLEQRYGIDVLHHKGQYDVEKRDSAYSNALPDLESVLEENTSIEVVIDLHRDGVPADRHLVTEINGKPTAQIMFFNGLSRTTASGNLDYLANPYIEDNLAFSFQMQLAASEYYPGFARKIYLKGYRYNMHLRPKSLLIEVGAQTNTFEEAKNAMEPLADILAKVLLQKSY